MSGSVNEDLEQRKTTNMEESNAMTIEFLRARLLSERSVSKSARQRADELARRVAELEDQLKFVSLQRKKAEKATVDVLAILENNGISDVSEEFDSCSDNDENPRDFNSRNGPLMVKTTSTNKKVRENENEAYSSSEIESSPSTGRGLSWRSTKDSQHSLEKKKYVDSMRRRASFASSSLSARRLGKSCRKIRHRETRSVEELQNDGTDKATRSRVASNGSDGEPLALRENSEYGNGKNSLESPTLRSNNETEKMNGRYINLPERDEDMESALQHQAQLIGRYEEEEKAQREWEEKFRENNSGAQDSGDPGNHSDVTEERYEMKTPELACAAEALNSDNQEVKHDPVDACFTEKPETPKNLPSLTDSLQDEKCSNPINACESSASEFSFPTSNAKNNQELLDKLHEVSEHRFQQSLPVFQTTKQGSTTSSNEGKNTPLSATNIISSPLELAVVPQQPSNNLETVLEALQRAKLSLNQKLNNSSPVAGQTSSHTIQPSYTEPNKVDNFQVPFGSPGLFRLPTDNQFEARPSFANFPSKNSFGRFLSEPLDNSQNDIFLTAPYRAVTQYVRPEFFHPQRSFSQPRLSEGPSSSRTNHLYSYINPYPFIPDVTGRSPLSEEGSSRTFPSSSERGLPSVMRLSSYDEHVRPNLYR